MNIFKKMLKKIRINRCVEQLKKLKEDGKIEVGVVSNGEEIINEYAKYGNVYTMLNPGTLLKTDENSNCINISTIHEAAEKYLYIIRLDTFIAIVRD